VSVFLPASAERETAGGGTPIEDGFITTGHDEVTANTARSDGVVTAVNPP
jgi:hypothetical protein